MEKEEIKNFIKELIEKTGVSVKEISVAEEGANNTWFKVEISEPHLRPGALSSLHSIMSSAECLILRLKR
jgi:hypothetical protein